VAQRKIWVSRWTAHVAYLGSRTAASRQLKDRHGISACGVVSQRIEGAERTLSAGHSKHGEQARQARGLDTRAHKHSASSFQGDQAKAIVEAKDAQNLSVRWADATPAMSTEETSQMTSFARTSHFSPASPTRAPPPRKAVSQSCRARNAVSIAGGWLTTSG
jgi:hypothetical protein